MNGSKGVHERIAAVRGGNFMIERLEIPFNVQTARRYITGL